MQLTVSAYVDVSVQPACRRISDYAVVQGNCYWINQLNNMNGEDESDEDDDYCDDDHEKLSLFRDPPAGYVRMRPSHFNGLPPTVFIEYPPELGIRRIDTNILEPMGKRKLIYKSHWERICIKNAFVRAGFTKTENPMYKSWTAMFSKHQTVSQMKDLNCLQKINHFPSSWYIHL